MKSSFGLCMIENCLDCEQRTHYLFCNLSPDSLQALEEIKYTTLYSKGTVLFVEGQSARGIFILCQGRVKLSTTSSDGKTLITEIAEGGEVLGLSATVSGTTYEVTAEALESCQVNFIRQSDFRTFLSAHNDAALRVGEHLSRNYQTAHEQRRTIGLARTSLQKFANFLLEWSAQQGKPTEQGVRLKITLTHEAIAQMIGASRETVTRLFGDLKSRGVIHVKGSTLLICDPDVLQELAHPG